MNQDDVERHANDAVDVLAASDEALHDLLRLDRRARFVVEREQRPFGGRPAMVRPSTVFCGPVADVGARLIRNLITVDVEHW